MKRRWNRVCCALMLALTGSVTMGAEELAKDWIDPYTGHRIVRISEEDGTISMYFNLNPYTLDGKHILVTSPSGLQSINLETDEVETLMSKQVRLIQTGRKTGDPYYIREGTIYAFSMKDRNERKVIDLPPGVRNIQAINCDETLFAGTLDEVDPSGQTPKPAPRTILPQWQRMYPTKKYEELTKDEITAASKEDRLSERLANPSSQCLVTINAQTGEVKKFGYAYAWLNHLQFSPTDSTLLMFCHEGTWHETQRIWTIRTDGTERRLMHKREMDMEIAGHEFFSPDGKWIWYDLQTPRSQVFWIAGINLKTGERVRYKVDRDFWSVHYNVSHDGKMFSGDGGDPAQVAFSQDGMWMNLFRVQPGNTVTQERLVDMSHQDYRTGAGEPNGSFTPDDKWIVFRANFLGPQHVFKVSVAKATEAERAEVMAKATPADMAIMEKKPRPIPTTVEAAARAARDTVVPIGPSKAAEDNDTFPSSN